MVAETCGRDSSATRPCLLTGSTATEAAPHTRGQVFKTSLHFRFKPHQHAAPFSATLPKTFSRPQTPGGVKQTHFLVSGVALILSPQQAGDVYLPFLRDNCHAIISYSKVPACWSRIIIITIMLLITIII